jgi:hypothetical protein
MGGIIYLIQDDDRLVEMAEQEYDSEDLLQKLLAQYPNLLAGDQINNMAPRRWLLVKREAGLPSEDGGADRWSVDHLFLDQDAVPTLVEVKRSTDTRIRREVVGQMLDYAANALVYWPMERIRAQFESTCQLQGQEAENLLRAFLNPENDNLEADLEEFWLRVKTNLQAGKVRMVFVADKIPSELQRVVEFLNSQMDPAEVLALEVKQFIGKGLKTLVPTIFGQTAAAEMKKSSGSSGPRPTPKQWDESSFFKEMELKGLSEEAKIASKILDWIKVKGISPGWGKGGKVGTFLPSFEINGKIVKWASFNTQGKLEVIFAGMNKIVPFDQEENRFELLRRLNEIPGISLPSDFSTWRSIPLTNFSNDSVLNQFLEVCGWVIQKIKSCE